MFGVAGLRETRTTLTQEEMDAIVEYMMSLR
jgi:hypothetical protein